MNGKVVEFLSGDGCLPQGPIFMPRSLGYGACLNRITPEEARNNSGLLLKSIQKEEELLCPDLLVLNYDLTYLAEMSGCQTGMNKPYCWEVLSGSLDGREAQWADFNLPQLAGSGRLALYREVLSIIKKLSKTPVISLVPTPFTLSRQLAGDSFLRNFIEGGSRSEELLDAALYVISDTVKLFLDSGSDGILFFEDLSSVETREPGLAINLIDFYRTLYNILKHYRRRAIFCISGKQPEVSKVYGHEMVAGICFTEQSPQAMPGQSLEPGGLVQGSGSSVDFLGTDEQLTQRLARDLDSIRESLPFIYSPLIPAQAQPEQVLALVREVHHCKDALLNRQHPAAAKS